MTTNDNQKKIKIDDKDYNLAELSDKVKRQIEILQFVDMQINLLNNELAVADTARIAYTNALKNDVERNALSEV